VKRIAQLLPDIVATVGLGVGSLAAGFAAGGMIGFAVEEQTRAINQRAIWITAGVLGAIWVVLFAIQRRRYRARGPAR